MDEFFDEIDALFSQTSPTGEPPLVIPPPNNSTSSIVFSASSTMQNSPIPPNITATTTIESSNQRPLSPEPYDPFKSTTNKFVFMPTPSLPSIRCSMSYSTTTIPDLGMSSTNIPYPDPQQQYNPLSDHNDVNIDGLLQIPYMNQQEVLFNQIPSYWNAAEDPLDPNWEAISAYLAGQVRPGVDGDRIFRCTTCGVEFPNAQAFGGHMSSHSKTKKEKILAPTKAKLKKVGTKVSKSFVEVEEVKAMKEEGASGKVNKLTTSYQKDKVEDSSKGKSIKGEEGYESEESVSSKFVVKDQSSTNEGHDE